VGRASSEKWSLRVRMMVVSRIKYYKNISTPRHPAWFLYYRSTVFPTQTFRDLLLRTHNLTTSSRKMRDNTQFLDSDTYNDTNRAIAMYMRSH
jgi:hypothetical protein